MSTSIPVRETHCRGTTFLIQNFWSDACSEQLNSKHRGEDRKLDQTNLSVSDPVSAKLLKCLNIFLQQRQMCRRGVYEVPYGPVCPSQCHYKAHELFPPFYQTYISGIFSEFRPRCPVLGDVEDCPSPEYQARIMNISQHESDSGYR